MVGERDVVEIVIFVVGVERAPTAILALHSQNPFSRASNRCAEVVLALKACARSIAITTTAVSSTSG